MALSQSALSELLDAIRAGGSEDVLREAMALVLQELIELEAAQAIGASRYERTNERTTHSAAGSYLLWLGRIDLEDVETVVPIACEDEVSDRSDAPDVNGRRVARRPCSHPQAKLLGQGRVREIEHPDTVVAPGRVDDAAPELWMGDAPSPAL